MDGFAGKNTKAAIRDLRRCSNKDPFGENDVKDSLLDDSKEELHHGSKNILYHIGIAPGYLQRKDVVQCIEKAFGLWSGALNGEIRFNLVQDVNKADIRLSWSTHSMREDNLMRFDGPGGVLGHGGVKSNNSEGFVVFDKSERWVINEKASDVTDPSTWYRGQPTISLFGIAAHEIGHSLGLDHSIDAKDLMVCVFVCFVCVLQMIFVFVCCCKIKQMKIVSILRSK